MAPGGVGWQTEPGGGGGPRRPRSGSWTGFQSLQNPNKPKKSHKDTVHRNVRMANSLRSEVIKLYKNLLYLGREYPKGADYFRSRLKAAFLKNKDETDPEKIKQLIARGEFVIKELEALYFLRKYRAMKQRYYSDDKP
ncbi:electron transfer flavoprotein regulatory factor 1 [Agelaius phoeniceus]|uniref:electron transfer flavoprotein regulatory factor 1 n=1 Tax=Agelaius phoeniceus TaxID=39638 RepID=UPI0040550A6B